MRIGVDQYTLRHLDGVRGVALLELVRAQGLDGFQFRDIHQVSRDLDPGEIREAHAHARAHGLYLEVGLSCPNPHHPGPAALRDGDGDLRAGLRRQLECVAVATVGSRAVRCFVAGAGARHLDLVPWTEQLAGTTAVARDLVPVLRDLDLKLAFENHADSTTFELVRMVETLGSEVAGINLDIGNLAITLEDPLCAVRRVAASTIAVHLKDGIVVFADNGLQFNPRPFGEGGLPIVDVLRALPAAPNLAISIEDHAGLYAIPIFDGSFLATFEDLEPRELSAVVRFARRCEQRIAAGDILPPEVIERTPWAVRAGPRLAGARDRLRAALVDLPG